MFVTVILNGQFFLFFNFSLKHVTARYKSNTVVRVKICVTSWKRAKNSDTQNKNEPAKNEIIEMINLLNNVLEVTHTETCSCLIKKQTKRVPPQKTRYLKKKIK